MLKCVETQINGSGCGSPYFPGNSKTHWLLHENSPTATDMKFSTTQYININLKLEPAHWGRVLIMKLLIIKRKYYLGEILI